MKTQTFVSALKNLKTQQYRLRVDGSNSLKTQTFENDWSCDLSPSLLAFVKQRVEDIDIKGIFVFIDISLLLSLIVNWQLNVYALKKNVFYTCAVEG